jgi:hypothetical protein
MSALHILDQDNGQFRCVAHQPVPAGSNTAGVAWKNVILGAGLNVTSMTEGALPGQISTAEKAQIVAGDVVEAAFTIPLHSGGTSNAQIDAYALAEFANWRYAMQLKYAYFGKVRG